MDLNLNVPQDSIFAFLGSNGAGKTTSIQMLMNIIKSTSGSVQIMGTDAKKLGLKAFERIGYVSENQQMNYHMTVGEFIEFCKPLYPNWDDVLTTKLLKQFNLPTDQAFQTLSRGMKMKAALLSSLAYHPQLLVLDEPFSGLDPRVRDELISGILEISDQEQWTVFISTHDVYEVEQLADYVGILDQGKLRLNAPIAHLQEKVRQVTVTCSQPPNISSQYPTSWHNVRAANHILQFVDTDYQSNETEAMIQKQFHYATHITCDPMTLREITIALTQPETN